MKSRQHSGSALVDYIIPTAVIGILLGLALYTFWSGGFLSKFISVGLKGEIKNQKLILGEQLDLVEPGELDGSPNDPKMSCNNGYCTIDFGDYILQGIPEQIGNVTTANRGGEITDEYADLLLQIADILEEQGDITSSSLLRQLVNEAKKMAAAEIAADKILSTFNDIEQRINQIPGNVYKKVQTTLASIDSAKPTADDYLSMISAAKYMHSQGTITNKELQLMTAKILNIKNKSVSNKNTNFGQNFTQQNFPNKPKPPVGKPKPPVGKLKPPVGKLKPPVGKLKPPADKLKPPFGGSGSNLDPDDIDFINNFKTSPEDIKELCEKVSTTLSEDDLAVIIKNDSIVYSIATNSLEGVSDYVDSTNHGSSGAGSNFDSLYKQFLSTPSTNPLFSTIKYVCDEIQTIGNAVTLKEIKKGDYSIVSLTIPEDAGIETAVAVAVLESASQ